MDRLNEELLLAQKLGLFDFNYYLSECGLDFLTDVEAFEHYNKLGWEKKHNPSRFFEASFYLRIYSDVYALRSSPLLHYLRCGRHERRRIRSGQGPLCSRPIAPNRDVWQNSTKRASAVAGQDDADSVDVVIPVYRGFNDTLACIYSVLNSNNSTPYRLIVIDDVSPDPALSSALGELAELGLIQLFRNEINLGFVGAANRGLQLSRHRDVVLLNSDTIVYGDWLDRLRFHAKNNKKVATVTPFSNNATILSYPYTLENNNTELEIALDELDRIFSRTNFRKSQEIITGVGFCFYVNRECLMEIGVFNEALFGRGYGEENDFCRRASKQGWSNLAALDTFVRHTGEVSFDAAATAAKGTGYAALLSVHPEYDGEVKEFIKNDGLRAARESIDVARVVRAAQDRLILLVEHGRGGGTTKHINELTAELQNEGFLVVHAAPSIAGEIVFSGLGNFDLPNLPTIDLSDPDSLASFVKSLGILNVHIHSLVDFDLIAMQKFCREIRAAGLRYYYTAHDYAAVCPRITMVDWGGVYCDSPAVEFCDKCLLKCESDSNGLNIEEWRELYSDVLFGAYRVITPHSDSASRLQKYFPSLNNIVVRPHFTPSANLNQSKSFRRSEVVQDATRIVGIVGAIGPHKGSALLIKLAADSLRRKLPVKFRLYGHSDKCEFELFRNVEVTGEYLEEDIDDIIMRRPPHMIFLPSVWPETFCYALDVAFRLKLFPVCFNLGAQAARICEAGFGTTVDLSLSFQPELLNDLLISMELPSVVGEFKTGHGQWTDANAYYDGALLHGPRHPGSAIVR